MRTFPLPANRILSNVILGDCPPFRPMQFKPLSQSSVCLLPRHLIDNNRPFVSHRTTFLPDGRNKGDPASARLCGWGQLLFLRVFGFQIGDELLEVVAVPECGKVRIGFHELRVFHPLAMALLSHSMATLASAA